MKLIVCVFLVLVILEEFHCDPCLDFFFNGRICGPSNTIHEGEYWREHRRYSPPRHQHYVTHGLGHRPWNQALGPQYSESQYWAGWHHASYEPQHSRPPYGAGWHHASNGGPQYGGGWHHASNGGPQYRAGWHHASNGGPQYGGGRHQASNGGPQYGAGWHHASNGGPQYGAGRHFASFGSQYGRPQYRNQYPLSFGTGYQTPNGSPSYTRNTPLTQTPVKEETPQGKQFFVTPDGIRETPAGPLNNSA